MRNQKGITLIALVITIIVLLILAGVSIATLMGDNGLLTKSQQGVRDNRIATAKDLVSTEAQALMVEYLNTKYTSNTSFTTTPATYVINGLKTKYPSTVGECEISYTTSEITITENDNKRKVVGTFDTAGALQWAAIADV